MPSETFAFLDLNIERFSQLVVNILAVGGAFLAGYFFSGVVAWVLDRWLLRGSSPQGLHKAIKNISGVALAILAALVLFGHGQGWTILGGGSDGDTNGTGEQSGGGPGTTPVTAPTTPVTPPTTKSIELPRDSGTKFDRVVVTVLAGEAVKDLRFYLIDDSPNPRTLRELEGELRSRRQAAGKPVGVVPIYPANSGRDTPGGLRLYGLAENEGFPIIPADSPK